MNRRKFVAASALIPSLGLFSGTVLAQDHKHHHGHKEAKDAVERELTKQEVQMMDSLAACLAKGEICVSHCIRQIAAGHHQLVECQSSVLNMTAVAESLRTIVGYGTADKPHRDALIRSVQMIMTACEKECDKHAKHHSECKECADACKSFSKSATALLKA